MGRVYAIDPDISKGERSAIALKVRAFAHPTLPSYFQGVNRIEFEADADEGLATITGTFFCNEQGKDATWPVVDFCHPEGKGHQYTIRGYCRIRHKDGSNLVEGGSVNDPNWVQDDEGNVWPMVTSIPEGTPHITIPHFEPDIKT
jgi:hypothetical protein